MWRVGEKRSAVRALGQQIEACYDSSAGLLAAQ